MKNKIRLFTLIILLICFFITYQASAADNNNYFPLDIGNQWTFEVDAAGQKITMSYTAVEKIIINGIETVVFEMKHGNMVQQREYYTRNNTGIHTVIRELSVYRFLFEPQQHFLKYPMVIGDSWDQSGSYADESKNLFFSYQQKCEYVGIETIEVPAGTFKVLKLSLELISSDGSHIKGYRYFSPGIGLVKEDFTLKINDMSIPVASVLTGYIPASGISPNQ